MLAHAVRIAVSTLVARGCGFVCGFISAIALAPASYGVFTSLRALLGTGGWTHLGAVEAYRREWPRLMAAGEQHAAAAVEKTAHRLAFLIPVVIWVASVATTGGLALFNPDGFVARNHLAIQLLLGTMLPISLESVRIEWLSVRGAMAAVARLRVVRGIAYTATIPIGAFVWGVDGAAGAVLLAEWVTAFAAQLECRRLKGAQPPCNTVLVAREREASAFDLLRLGFPITLIWQCVIFQDSVDRTVVLQAMGARAAGLHALGALAASAAFAIPEALSRVMNPRMCADAGRSDDAAVARQVDSVTANLSLWMPSALVALAFFIPPVLEVFLPDYRDAAGAAAILVAGAGLTALVPAGVDWLVATGRVRRFLLLGPAVLLIRCILTWAAAVTFDDIRIVALAGVASAASFVVLLEVMSGRTGGIRRLVQRVIPGLLAVGVVLIADASWIDTVPIRIGVALGAAIAHHMVVRCIRAALPLRASIRS